MSSVQRFLRQRTTGSTLAPVSSTDVLYVLQPGSGNYVGNYPNPFLTTTPGVMVTAGTTPVLNAVTAGGYYRDMGKTVFAAVGTAGAAGAGTLNAAATPGYFRAVQIITPGYGQGSGATNPGALPLSAFGVGLGINGNGLPNSLPSGSNPGDDGYNTYYLPIEVGGVVASNSTGTGVLSVGNAGIRLSEQL